MATVNPMSTIGARARLSILSATTMWAVVSLVGCSGEEAVPIDPADPPVADAEPPNVTHALLPTPEMEQLARQQCLDDPSLMEGYVQAVDPDNDQVLTEISVDCTEVRADG